MVDHDAMIEIVFQASLRGKVVRRHASEQRCRQGRKLTRHPDALDTLAVLDN